MTILVDTNVLLDVLRARVPHNVASDAVWRMAEMEVVKGYVAAISFNNLFYIVNKQIGFSAAMAAVGRVRQTFTLVPFDTDLLDRATSIAGVDLEDAIQAASALRIAADFLTTRNARDFAALGVTAVTPMDFLAIALP
jgi:predicted nucleic acid-binding protein